VMVLVLGAIIGKIAEESGAAQKLVFVLTKSFGVKNIQWAILCTGLLAGIPLFYNAGFVVLVPLVFVVAKTTGLPLLYVGLPMVAPLSVTHGFLPPHPGPVALAAIFHASIGKTLLYGLIVALPLAVIAGIVYPRLVVKHNKINHTAVVGSASESVLPTAVKSFMIILSPVVLIAIGTAGIYFTNGWLKNIFLFLQEPTLALLLSLCQSLIHLKLNAEKTAFYCAEGIKAIAVIVLVIAAGGAFKQVLVDSKVGDAIKAYTNNLHLSPLVLGWLIAALFRVALGSATVAALTASGIMVPFLAPGVSPELMVLSVGAGSLFFSHVNDTGFWMFKEYVVLSMKQTFQTWTEMETLISVLGLAGVLLLNWMV
jgi:Gnt-I system high-affinity gluconate transporter